MDLTAALVDIFSVSGAEAGIATAVQDALREQAPHLEVVRNGDTVLARTSLGRASRVVRRVVRALPRWAQASERH